MELFRPSYSFVPVLTIALTALMMPIYCQINTPCSPSMLNTVTPCVNFLTNSSSSNASPTADCCESLKTLTNGGMGCLCLIVTGSFPFRIPINRTLAISLPRACNMPGVPVQCKAAPGAPIPAPGPTSLAPTLSPGVSPTLSPKGSVVPEPTPSAQAPESDTPAAVTPPSLTPPSSTVGSEAPTDSTTGSHPVLTPSVANPSYSLSPFIVVLTLGFAIFKNY